NSAAELVTTLGPIQLLVRLKHVKKLLGRKHVIRWGPRIIDLDILLYGDLTLDRRGLTIPHPRIDERSFVLLPLRDLLPGYRSATGDAIDTLIARASQVL